jgi:small conductance mechanosensitive channel
VIWAADESRSISEVIEDSLPDAAMTLIVVVVAIVVWLVFKRVGQRYAQRLAERPHSDGPHEAAERAQRIETLWSVLRALVAVAIVVVVVLTIMAIWGIPIGPFLAVGTVIGVALGFGAQDMVRDFIAGFLIIAEDQFSVGDVVSIAGVTGTVQEIRLRITVLRDLDGRVHYVPNGKIEVATNYTQKFSQIVVDVSVAYKEDVDRVIAVLDAEAGDFAADPEWSDRILEPPAVLGVNELGESGVEVRVVFVTSPGERWAVRREFLRRIKNRLDAESIEIPFPHLTVIQEAEHPPAGGSPGEPPALA